MGLREESKVVPKRIIERLLCVILCVGLVLVQLPSIVYAHMLKVDSVEYDIQISNQNKGKPTDTAMEVLEQIQTLVKEDGIELDIYKDKPLPPEVDLSDSKYLPKVGNQAHTPTCGSFSTVYYQYSYEVNRKNEISSKKDRVVYSPFYIFSFSTGSIEMNYKHLQERGCIKYSEWTQEHGEEVEVTQGALLHSSNIDAMRDALNMRIDHYYKYYEPHTNEDVGSAAEKLRVIKTLLANEMVLVSCYGADNIYWDEDEEVVCYVGSSNDGGHAVAIIGYDDNKGYDVNGDGEITGAEKGALKVRNSWGTSIHGDGDYWVLYDAIVNTKSQIVTSKDLFTEKTDIELPDITLEREENKDTGEIKFTLVTKNAHEEVIAEEVIYKGERDKLATFLTRDVISAMPKDGNKVRRREWLEDCMIEVCEGNPTEEEKKIIQDWFSKNQEHWNYKLFYTYRKMISSDDGINKLPCDWEAVLACGYGDRGKMFTEDLNTYNENNFFSFISVESKEVQLVGQVTYQIDHSLNSFLRFSKDDRCKIIPERNEYVYPVETTEVLDLTELIESRNDLIGEQTWKAELLLTDNNDSSNFEFSLTDDCGKLIPTKVVGTDNNLFKREISLSTNLQLGDLDYDGWLEKEDLELAWNIICDDYDIYDDPDYSVLQEYLMDYNGNDILEKEDFRCLMDYAYKAICEGDTSVVKVSMEELKEFVREHISEIEPGDNHYDGRLNRKDFDDLLDYLKGNRNYSPLQMELFDYYGDGVIDFDDLHEILFDAYEAVYFEENPYVEMTEDEFVNLLCDLRYYEFGDVTGDGRLDAKDEERLKSMIANPKSSSLIEWILGDMNKDAKLTEEDLEQLKENLFYVDVNFNGKYTVEDIEDVRNHLSGAVSLTTRQQGMVDFNANGQVDNEDFYMLIYGYYLHMDVNPDLTRNEFYNTMLQNYSMSLGDLNGWGYIDGEDVELFKKALAGEPVSYRALILADVNMDLKLDEKDVAIYEEHYMSDIPFTYTLDENAKTMTLTGAEDNTITCMKIAEQYTVNCEKYTVTGIADNAFSNCVNLEEVYIPDSVTKIAPEDYRCSPFYEAGNMALKIYCEAPSMPEGFTKCWYGQKSYQFGYTMKDIGDYFYYKADSEHKTLEITGVKGNWYMQENETVCIDDRYLVNGEEYRVIAIGDYAFNYEGNIVSMELPSGITVIGEGAFSEMEHLENIDLMRCVHLKEIKASAFAYCDDLEKVWIPNSVEVIHSDTVEESIFYKCSDDLWVLVDSTYSKDGWGDYWNYIDEDTVADTDYVEAPFA